MDLDLDATYRIALIAKSDAYYLFRKEYIGKDIKVTKVLNKYDGNWVSCLFYWLDTGEHSCFYKILLKKLDKQPTIEDKTYVSASNR